MDSTRRIALLLAALLAVGCSGREPTGAPAPGSAELLDTAVNGMIPPIPPDVENQWVTVLEDGIDPYVFAAENNLEVLAVVAGTDLVLFESDGTFQILDDPDIRVAHENDIAVWSNPVDLTLGFSQGAWNEEEVTGQEALVPLNLDAANTKATGKGVTVAVLDTGVEATHPHLAGRVDLLPPGSALGSLETPNGIDDDGNGVIDDAWGHGTHVAGTVLWIAPDARVLSIRVLNEEGWGTEFDLAAGLVLAQQAGVDVINLSLALTGVSPVIQEILAAIRADGIVILAAAGNSYAGVLYPASDPGTVSVAAADQGGGLAEFSGAWVADMAAPGVDVASSYRLDKLAYGTGTSMACAVASGCLALTAEVPGNPAAETGIVSLCTSAIPMLPRGAVGHGEVRPLQALGVLDAPVLLEP